VASFQPRKIIEVLNEYNVAYVLIGGLAAIFHGSPVSTGDADICPKRSAENLQRLAAALRAMNAGIFSPDAPSKGHAFTCDATFLDQMEMLNLATDYGRLDIAMTPSGTRGFDDLSKSAETFAIKNTDVPVASLADVIRSKEAAGRLKDQRTLPLLREIQDKTNQ